VPFFRNANGLVQDFYDGNIDGPEVLMARAELNIVVGFNRFFKNCNIITHFILDAVCPMGSTIQGVP
jgi:hypothetical protein